MEIEVRSLRKEYGGLIAVDDVAFSLPRGSILALIGPNGAGKTSLMKMIAALLPPTSGTVRVGEIDAAENPKGLHDVIGFLPDFFGLYDEMTVVEYLEYFARAYAVPKSGRPERIQKTIQLVGLEAKATSSLQHLSRGMRQRIGIARALINDPPIVLLDEPASGLDPEARGELQALLLTLAGQGKTLIVSSHILTELEEYCTHVAIMNSGRLRAFGRIDEVRAAAISHRRFQAEFIAGAQEAARVLGTQSGVSDVRTDDGRVVHFTFQGTADSQAALVRLLIENGYALLSFVEEQTKIHDAYMSMMKGTSN